MSLALIRTGFDEVVTDQASVKDFLTSIHLLGQQRRGQPLGIFTVTHNTSDFGSKFVVRHGHGSIVNGEFRHFTRDEVVTADSLDELRSVMPDDCVVMARSECDDPVIVETWI